MRVAGTTFAETDQVCDYIPLVSTISNLTDLFQKCVVRCLSEGTTKDRYWTHIKQKDLFRCVILLVPILGNIYVLASDYFKYKMDMVKCQKMLCDNAATLAEQVQLLSGRIVSPDEMMPAVTEDQKRLCAACLTNNAQTIQNLLLKGVSPNFYHFGSSPLVLACQKSNPEIVQLLVRAGADVKALDRWLMSPFLEACKRGNLEIVQFLLENGIDPQKLEIAEFVLKIEGDSQKKEPFNNNVLHYASRHRPILEILLKKSNDAQLVNQKNYFGLTPLHSAIESNQADSALLLLENGANPLIPDNNGKIPLILACEKNFVEVVAYIRKYYSDNITHEIHEQAKAAAQAAAATRKQAGQPQPTREDPLLSVIDGALKTCSEILESEPFNPKKQLEKIKELGPVPRTGMEILLGKIDWPYPPELYTGEKGRPGPLDAS